MAARVETDPSTRWPCDGAAPDVVVVEPTAVVTRSGDLVCEHSGGAVVTKPLEETGTTAPQGDDYLRRVAGLLGVVDVGVPDGAAWALHDHGGWTLAVPLGGLEVVRFRLDEGGSFGPVRFLAADGTDLTPTEVPLPDVIHGVDREDEAD